jgi:hypothetical protein
MYYILFQSGTSAAETHKMLREARGNDALSQTMTYEWSNILKME